MKKLLLVLVSVLLLAGVAQAAEWTQALTADLSARNQGRSVATDSAVVLKIWSGGALTNPAVGVSSGTTLMIYTNPATPTGFALDLGTSNLDTIGEVVDYINTNFASDSAVKINASVGSDAYRDLASAPLSSSVTTLGITKDTATGIKNISSRFLAAGVEAVDGVIPRIKSVSCQIPGSATNGVTLAIYDGNTKVWQRFTGLSAYNSATADAASPNTVIFPEAKGISATKGNGIVAVATVNANVDTDTVAKATENIAIVYDNLRD